MAALPFQYGYAAVKETIRLSVPKNGLVSIASLIAGIWSYQIVATYGPGKIAQLVGNYVFIRMGQGAGAYFLAYFFIAPAMVPSITPWVACGAAFLAALTVTVLTNKVIFWYNQ